MNKQAIGAGTFGGVILGIFPSLLIGDIIKTVLLAAVGAIVSFFVSLILSRFIKK